ncbi:dol-P-Glc:Glc(2)Man(9)GlcNAc(2)-PP-Dol alpha-1,2-glucosyltransferase-like isoform X1 [Apium graveolens]|uniref:dol-P-Glc:Glc(2)Man(9)GlcNAc(2)-PP-Dol alpha-1,2-glucosyltransferase-like isoform X1 n=1 Tax=Apium graveolens TaxID=4045 RepID=UPI003D7AD8B7
MNFALVSCLSMAPVHYTLSQTAALLRSFHKSRVLGSVLYSTVLTAGFLLVHYYSTGHPYLLSDNRHNTFYLWRKNFKAHWFSKYPMVPLNLYSWFFIFSVLVSEENVGAGTFLGMCGCSDSCSVASVDRFIQILPPVVSSFILMPTVVTLLSIDRGFVRGQILAPIHVMDEILFR